MTNLSDVFQGNFTGIAQIDYGQYVDRGDPSTYDFDQTDLTTDGTWRDLDLSSILPSNAAAVHLKVGVYDETVGNAIYFRKNGNTNSKNSSQTTVQTANTYHYDDIIVPCDTSQIIEYFATNTTFTYIYIGVRGWFLEKTTTGGWLDSPLEFGANDEMTNTNQPYFRATPTAGQTNLTINVQNTISFTENIDVGNNFGSNLFTAPVSGKYILTLDLVLSQIDASAVYYYIRIATSNQTYHFLWSSDMLASDMTYKPFVMSVVADMDAADTAYVSVNQSGGAAQTDVLETYSSFTGMLIG